ncbi:hypothetical protein A4X13_0g8356 [Tilletia indica]|uniref:Uncharacterized protein n=1 Tax=Tilletia indica TaxID=43049 RepID=A0A8T8SF95_9BASI|nr:hypothetical protein A4X13_0g8356 [Tilletia indica]
MRPKRSTSLLRLLGNALDLARSGQYTSYGRLNPQPLRPIPISATLLPDPVTCARDHSVLPDVAPYPRSLQANNNHILAQATHVLAQHMHTSTCKLSTHQESAITRTKSTQTTYEVTAKNQQIQRPTPSRLGVDTDPFSPQSFQRVSPCVSSPFGSGPASP